MRKNVIFFFALFCVAAWVELRCVRDRIDRNNKRSSVLCPSRAGSIRDSRKWFVSSLSWDVFEFRVRGKRPPNEQE